MQNRWKLGKKNNLNPDLSPENPAFGMALFATLFTFLLGFMVYVYSVILVNREGAGPYPVWMHTFYCAADFMGVWVFLSAYDAVGGFWFFMLGAVGEAVWVGVEIYCLYKTVTVERWEMWGKDATVGHGKNYIDGGVRENLPIKEARDLGYDIVIAVEMQRDRKSVV